MIEFRIQKILQVPAELCTIDSFKYYYRSAECRSCIVRLEVGRMSRRWRKIWPLLLEGFPLLPVHSTVEDDLAWLQWVVEIEYM